MQDEKTEKPKIHYELSVQLKDLNLPKFLGISASFYVCENLLYYPFDVIRTRLQVDRDAKISLGKSLNMAKTLGVRGLYAGFTSSTIGSLPPHAIYFLSYNYAKDVLQKFHDKQMKRSHSSEGKQAFWVSFVAGAFADLAANIFVVPLEVVVQRLQIQDHTSAKKYSGGIDAVRTIYRTEGPRGFFRGFGATLLAYAPASAVWWATYEQSKAYISKAMSKESSDGQIFVENHAVAQIIGGAIAGWATVVTTNPMDVIKTRLQTQHHQANFGGENMQIYSNSWHALTEMFKKEGYRAFTRGIGPKLITTTFFSSWFGLCYDLTLGWSRKTPLPQHPQ